MIGDVCYICGSEEVKGYVPADYVYWTFKPICYPCYLQRLKDGTIDNRNIVKE